MSNQPILLLRERDVGSLLNLDSGSAEAVPQAIDVMEKATLLQVKGPAPKGWDGPEPTRVKMRRGL
jgi:hypothetical protein